MPSLIFSETFWSAKKLSEFSGLFFSCQSAAETLDCWLFFFFLTYSLRSFPLVLSFSDIYKSKTLCLKQWLYIKKESWPVKKMTFSFSCPILYMKGLFWLGLVLIGFFWDFFVGVGFVLLSLFVLLFVFLGSFCGGGFICCFGFGFVVCFLFFFP